MFYFQQPQMLYVSILKEQPYPNQEHFELNLILNPFYREETPLVLSPNPNPHCSIALHAQLHSIPRCMCFALVDSSIRMVIYFDIHHFTPKLD